MSIVEISNVENMSLLTSIAISKFLNLTLTMKSRQIKGNSHTIAA